MKILLCTFLSLCSLIGHAQWTERLVTTQADGTYVVLAADIDNDSNMDVLNLNNLPGWDFVWYRNVDGQGDFAPPNSIGTIDEPRYMAVGDLDGDGDLDLVGSSPFMSTPTPLVWFENLDGQGNFGSLQELTSPITESERRIVIGDIDGDGDNDLVIGGESMGAFIISWFENTDGNGNFLEQVIASNINPVGIDLGDIDGDGDLDICVGSSLNGNGDFVNKWFRNNGDGSFNSPIEFGTPNQVVPKINLVDLDNDGDLDLIGVSNLDKLIWWENLDGNGTFSDDKLIATGPSSDIFPVDLDNDGDPDLLSVVSLPEPDGLLGWYEHLDGQGNFGPLQIIDTLPFPLSVTAADLDNDGDMDPITASQVEDTVVWYENDLLGVGGFFKTKVSVYPNPMDRFLRVHSTEPIHKVSIYPLLGQALLTVHDNFGDIDVSALASGLYFVEVRTEMGSVVKRVVKE